MPFTRLEVAVMSLIDGQLQVLLARRAEAPHASKWALPGGVLRIELDRTLDAAARRVMHERLGLELPFVRQLCAVGGPSRDPRAPWALSIVYRALVRAGSLKPSPGKRIEALAWRPVQEAIEDKRLAFDHATLIEGAAEGTRAEVDRLEGCVHQLLEFTRTETLSPHRIDPLTLVDKVLCQERTAFERRGIVVTVDDERRARRQVNVDPLLINQVMTTILVNAQEAMPDGGRLRIRLSEHGPRLRIAFTDTGPGIPPEKLSRVGEPFFTTKTRGLGLGLALARRIVERFGGGLTIANAAGGGAQVVIELMVE